MSSLLRMKWSKESSNADMHREAFLSFVKGKPYTGFYFDKEGGTDGERRITHSVWWERFYRPKGEMVPGNQNTDGRSSPLKKLKSLKQVLTTADDETALDDNIVAISQEIQDELDGRT
jgi:hypothetical protein